MRKGKEKDGVRGRNNEDKRLVFNTMTNCTSTTAFLSHVHVELVSIY